MDVIRARETIGKQIKSKRDTLGWSRYWLSKVTGVSETQIKSIEDGFLQSSDWSTFNKKTGLVQAPTELTAQTASITTSNVAYTTPASDGWYRISVTATVTTAAATSMDLSVQLRYTEATDNVIKSFPTSNVNNYNRTQTNTTGATVSISAVCHVKASTDIKYYTTFSPVGGSPKYNLHVTIEKLDY